MAAVFKCHSPSHNAAIVTPNSDPLETKSASASPIPTPLVTRLQLVANATASTAASPAAKIAIRPDSSRPRWYNAARRTRQHADRDGQENHGARLLHRLAIQVDQRRAGHAQNQQAPATQPVKAPGGQRPQASTRSRPRSPTQAGVRTGGHKMAWETQVQVVMQSGFYGHQYKRRDGKWRVWRRAMTNDEVPNDERMTKLE